MGCMGVDSAPVMQQLDDVLERLKVAENGKGKLIFDNSPIRKNGAAQEQLQFMYDKLGKKMVSAETLEGFTGQIDELTGLLKSSGYKNSQANSALAKVKSAINGALGSASADFESLNKQYAQYIQALNVIKDAAKVKSGQRYVFDGRQVLRRLLGNAPKKNEEALKAVEILKDIYKKSTGKTFAEAENLLTKAEIAEFVEKASQTFNPGSLRAQAGKEQIKEVGAGLLENIPVVGPILKSKALQGVAERPVRQTENLRELLKVIPEKLLTDQELLSAAQPGGKTLKEILSSLLRSQLGERVAAPQRTGGDDFSFPPPGTLKPLE